MLKTYTLKNGLKVATYSIPSMKSASLRITVKGGSIFDDPKKSGVAHFMEHILCQGIPSLPSVTEFNQHIEGLAGSYNASTSPELVKFYGGLPARHIEEFIKISSEVFFEPLFPENSIEKERNAIMEEIRGRMSQTGYRLGRFFKEKRYKKGHPMLMDLGGGIDTVPEITRDDIVEYWKRFFDPSNTYLIISGGIDNNQVEKWVNQYFEKYQPKVKFPGFPKLSNKDFTGRGVFIRTDKDLKTCDIDIDWPTIPGNLDWRLYLPQSIAHSILGRLYNSRLHKLLREELGIVYGVRSGVSSMQNFADCYISTNAVEKNVPEVMRLIARELSAFVKNGPTQQELDLAKNYRIDSLLMQFDHPSDISAWVESDLLWENETTTPEGYIKEYEKITIEDITQFMNKNWDFSKLLITIQGTMKNSSKNVKLIKDFFEEIK